ASPAGLSARPSHRRCLVSLASSTAVPDAKPAARPPRARHPRVEARGRMASERRQIMNVVARLLPGPREADARRGLEAAAGWLARAQDVTGCGGVSAYYDAA